MPCLQTSKIGSNFLNLSIHDFLKETTLFVYIYCSLESWNVSNLDNFRNLTDENFGGAYMSISQVVDYFNLKNFPHINILKTKQYVQLMPFCIYYRKHSCLVRPFNEQISLLTSSGMIVSWARLYKTPNYKHSQIQPKTQSLTFNQISGLITVCGLLIVISVIVFGLELMSTSHETIKIVLDFVTFNKKQKTKRRFPAKIKHSNLINLNRS